MLKKIKAFGAILLVLVICFSSVTTALADEENTGESGEPGEPVNGVGTQAVIIKTLRMPVGTNTPDARFEFEAKFVRLNDSDDEPASIPELNNLVINFTEADRPSGAPVNGIVSIQKTTGDILQGVTFPHAGIFEFEVRELPKTNPPIDTNTIKHMLNYSKAEYILRVYVTNEGTGTRVSAVIMIATADDNGNPIENNENRVHKVSRMEFVNNFVKTNTVVDPSVGSTLFVRKQVAGELASRETLFDFSITLTIPDLGQTIPSYYRAYIVQDGKVIDPDENADEDLIDKDEIGRYIMVSTDSETMFRLRDGQRLVFVDTPVGTSYVVEEAANPHYAPSVIVTTDNSEAPSTPTIPIIGAALSTGPQLVGESLNSAAFTNTRNFISPTGLSINDLPFIGIILLAIGALVVFVAFKTRKRRNHN